MANLIINVRCTCEEEFLLLHKLHKLYQEDQLRKRLKDRLVAVQGNGDGTKSYTVKVEDEPVNPYNPYNEKLLQAQDGGIDALGNPPLPEKSLTLDEARAIGAYYAEREEKLACVEEPVPDNMWKKPEITLTDVLEAEVLSNVGEADA